MRVWQCKTHCRLLFLTLTGILPSKEFYQGYIGAQSDLTQVMTLNKNIWDSAAELTRTKEEEFWRWIVKIDRQFCGTVYVISWTVVLILSSSEYGDSRKIVNLEHVFVSFQDFVGKTRNFSAGVVARFGREEGYT